MSPWIRKGECTRCGTCCKQVGARHMLDDAGVCKYLEEHPDGTYDCRITDGLFRGDAKLIPPSIPHIDYNYWIMECRTYPNPENEDHCPPLHKLPSECMFRMVKKDGE